MKLIEITAAEYIELLNHQLDNSKRQRMKMLAHAAMYSGHDRPFLMDIDLLPPGWSYLVKSKGPVIEIRVEGKSDETR